MDRGGTCVGRALLPVVAAALTLLLAGAPATVPAQALGQIVSGQPGAQATDSPVGLWRNIDDETGQPKALVRVVETAGVYSGRIEKILTERTDAVCDLCTDARKGQRVQGMAIIEGMRASVSEDGLFEGGSILDPSNGKVYRSYMRLRDDGSKLEVRGYVGVPLFGRSQTWIRED